MLTAELNGLNADSRVWMKEPQSLFPSFWSKWNHKFSFKLSTPMLKIENTQHLQIILTAVRTAAAQIIQDVGLWPFHQSFSCLRTYFSSATAISWKPCAVMLFLSHITVLRGGGERKEKKKLNDNHWINLYWNNTTLYVQNCTVAGSTLKIWF